VQGKQLLSRVTIYRLSEAYNEREHLAGPYCMLFVPRTEWPNSLLKLDPFKPFTVN